MTGKPAAQKYVRAREGTASLGVRAASWFTALAVAAALCAGTSFLANRITSIRQRRVLSMLA